MTIRIISPDEYQKKVYNKAFFYVPKKSAVSLSAKLGDCLGLNYRDGFVEIVKSNDEFFVREAEKGFSVAKKRVKDSFKRFLIAEFNLKEFVSYRIYVDEKKEKNGFKILYPEKI